MGAEKGWRLEVKWAWHGMAHSLLPNLITHRIFNKVFFFANCKRQIKRNSSFSYSHSHLNTFSYYPNSVWKVTFLLSIECHPYLSLCLDTVINENEKRKKVNSFFASISSWKCRHYYKHWSNTSKTNYHFFVKEGNTERLRKCFLF